MEEDLLSGVFSSELEMDDAQIDIMLSDNSVNNIKYLDEVSTNQVLVAVHGKNEAVLDTGCTKSCEGVVQSFFCQSRSLSGFLSTGNNMNEG